jgi:hypothetical protein
MSAGRAHEILAGCAGTRAQGIVALREPQFSASGGPRRRFPSNVERRVWGEHHLSVRKPAKSNQANHQPEADTRRM